MKLYRVLFWLWAVIILTFSSIPSLSIPLKDGISWDKMAHFMEYFIFSFLYYRYQKAISKSLQSIYKQLFIMMLVIPVLDELHQLLIPGRQCSYLDVIADMLGFLVIIIILIIKDRKQINDR